MDALIHSFSLVTLAEIGDKTQLLSILLAARYRTFWPIIAGVFCATLLNHALVTWMGYAMGSLVETRWVTLVTSLLFIAVGLWTLIPDHAPETSATKGKGAFMASCIAFFLAEMGDKTQLATFTLGAQYTQTMQVIVGSTLGMLAANVPAVLLGDKLLQRIPLRAVRILACVMFLGFGLAGLAGWWMNR